MNHNAIELAIYTLLEEMKKRGATNKQLDTFQESTWGLFGLSINGLTQEEEKAICQSIGCECLTSCACDCDCITCRLGNKT